MKKILFLLVFICISPKLRSQTALPDTVQFFKLLHYTNKLVEYNDLMQNSFNQLNSSENDSTASVWFGLNDQNNWHTVGGNFYNNKFNIAFHYSCDSTLKINNYTGPFDTILYTSLGNAMYQSKMLFQQVLDTTSLYFDSFVNLNSDNTISVWFLPAFQPSGQAIYGWEWEYVFEYTGSALLTCNSYTSSITGVWIGQPREIWLNYRNVDIPTVGSLYFALSYRDFFTRLRIDTSKVTSTTVKDKSGNYTWNHKLK